jgi:type III restriction enzyme
MTTRLQQAFDEAAKLPESEQEMLASRLLAELREEDQTIQHTDGVVGGRARVRNTRIAVWTLVQFKKLGRSDAELLGDFPGLTLADLDAVWRYYRNHTAEIEQDITAEAAED